MEESIKDIEKFLEILIPTLSYDQLMLLSVNKCSFNWGCYLISCVNDEIKKREKEIEEQRI
jgi:hypothetical protein